MSKNRMEAFSDGVIAIILTVMVLEMKAPEGAAWTDLRSVLPKFLSYVLSFVFLGIYWNNHHHLLQAVRQVNGRILWANLHLLFWLSLVPFVTAWMGEYPHDGLPVAMYGVVLALAGTAYFILTQALLAHHGKDSLLSKAVGNDFKGKISVIIYLVAIPFAFFESWIAIALYILVAVTWLVPDQRIENLLIDAARDR